MAADSGANGTPLPVDDYEYEYDATETEVRRQQRGFYNITHNFDRHSMWTLT